MVIARARRCAPEKVAAAGEGERLAGGRWVAGGSPARSARRAAAVAQAPRSVFRSVNSPYTQVPIATTTVMRPATMRPAMMAYSTVARPRSSAAKRFRSCMGGDPFGRSEERGRRRAGGTRRRPRGGGCGRGPVAAAPGRSGAEIRLEGRELALHPGADGDDDGDEAGDDQAGDDRVLDGLQAAVISEEQLQVLHGWVLLSGLHVLVCVRPAHAALTTHVERTGRQARGGRQST